jgi:threonine/homoserine/homoserine lactone efflux protein
VGQAIGDMLPAAVGVAISPLSIVAVVLILVSARGRVNGPSLLLGWIVGVAGVGTILLLVASGAGANDEGDQADWVGWLKLVLGLALIRMASRQFRSRPHGDEEPVTPKWMGALDSFTPPKAAGAGIVLSALNPKNLVLIAAGMSAIAGTGIPGGDQAVALIVFTVVATIGVAVPVVIYFALGERSAETLDHLRIWLVRHNAVIVAVLLLVIGVKLIGDAISALS